MDKFVHLMKLSVGSESVEAIEDWQQRRSRQRADGDYYHLTRMWPKREAELLNGGSIYWVVKGVMQARQRILRLQEIVGDDGIRRCGIVLDPQLIRTTAVPKRPFQGWRYLDPADAPPDLPQNRQSEDALPPELAGALADIGVL
ncbi:DUF1489 domain-containing protein [Aestuariicoccus sp. MJ-SS9]|uniref:DUF1489 family protein n=1 Tax=Aestuariicoccus sp. MJ-SS9 TaxID=3079855 RepID=UPI0029107D7A|nr:DUF1489 domain-containing protein [Aestuariicoccus sp. MJ-SS9]MDU8911575.1 DUF1489 domain-containing protein [Aestuariicoccus sp. MJ-SS9]